MNCHCTFSKHLYLFFTGNFCLAKKTKPRKLKSCSVFRWRSLRTSSSSKIFFYRRFPRRRACTRVSYSIGEFYWSTTKQKFWRHGNQSLARVRRRYFRRYQRQPEIRLRSQAMLAYIISNICSGKEEVTVEFVQDLDRTPLITVFLHWWAILYKHSLLLLSPILWERVNISITTPRLAWEHVLIILVLVGGKTIFKVRKFLD